ncbi:hypothetical protein LP7551_01623 [Roseibium album]|nr:hypothetical protein LP7551_01623 [Roseibium album]
MARLLKFNGTQSLPGVGNPQVVADTAVGEAVAGFGRQIGNSAGVIGNLAQKAANTKDARLKKRAEEQQKSADNFEYQKVFAKLDAFLKLLEDERRERSRAGEQNYVEKGLALQQEASRAMLEDLPVSVRPQAEKEIQQHRKHYTNRLAAQEYTDSQTYYVESVSEITSQLADEVSGDHEAFDRAWQRIGNTLDAAPLQMSQKEKLLQQGQETLAEAWVNTRPLQEQIDGLTALKNKRQSLSGDGIETDPAAIENQGRPNKKTGGTEPGKITEISSIFDQRAQVLPRHTQEKLLVGAFRKKAAAAVLEEERFVALIGENPLATDPQDIHDSGFLDVHQKKRMLDNLQDQIREQELDLEAVDWVGGSEKGDPFSPEDNDRLERAFVFLTNDETDRTALAHRLLAAKGILSRSYAKEVLVDLNGEDPDKMVQAQEKLSAIFDIAPLSLRYAGNRPGDLEDAEAKWRLLTGTFGKSHREVAQQLGETKNTARRKNLDYAYKEKAMSGDFRSLGSEGFLAAIYRALFAAGG